MAVYKDLHRSTKKLKDFEMKNCSIRGCKGKYKDKIISRLLTHKGQQVVLENIPAEVCDVCGDVLISLDTSVAIEKTLKNLNNCLFA